MENDYLYNTNCVEEYDVDTEYHLCNEDNLKAIQDYEKSAFEIIKKEFGI